MLLFINTLLRIFIFDLPFFKKKKKETGSGLRERERERADKKCYLGLILGLWSLQLGFLDIWSLILGLKTIFQEMSWTFPDWTIELETFPGEHDEPE